MRTPDAIRQRRARQRRRPQAGSMEALSQQPADLPLSAYMEADATMTARLVAEFGEAAALRILNGKPYVVAVER